MQAWQLVGAAAQRRVRSPWSTDMLLPERPGGLVPCSVLIMLGMPTVHRRPSNTDWRHVSVTRQLDMHKTIFKVCLEAPSMGSDKLQVDRCLRFLSAMVLPDNSAKAEP